jgi:hypothetical protein
MECKNIDVIAANSEKYISFSFDRAQFKDSLAFIKESLDTLSKNMKYDGNGNKIDGWQNNFKNVTSFNTYVENDEDLDLLTCKGVYPYEYMDCFNKFAETEKLPTKDKFYDSLHNKLISIEDYNHAK